MYQACIHCLPSWGPVWSPPAKGMGALSLPGRQWRGKNNIQSIILWLLFLFFLLMTLWNHAHLFLQIQPPPLGDSCCSHFGTFFISLCIHSDLHKPPLPHSPSPAVVHLGLEMGALTRLGRRELPCFGVRSEKDLTPWNARTSYTKLSKKT